ncbi:MAG TPA: response regulator [Terriglobia bacterium]|nr:response regulator [Terriglobia bacterium]
MKQKILLADDSPTIRRLVTQTFVDGRFEVVAVSNGEAAIKALEELRPSIVLADIYMPGKNGYEVCAYVRHHATLGATPVVLLVGAFDAFDEQVATRSGATANITKPFEPGALIELVRSLVPPEEERKEEVKAKQPEAPAPEETKPLSKNVRPGSSPPAPAEAGVSGESDLLGLETIFKEEPEAESAPGISDEDIDRIADRVIQRLSTQVIESIAWDVVPDITEKIVREELKRIDES